MRFVISEEEKKRIKMLYENSEGELSFLDIPELKNKTVTFDCKCGKNAKVSKKIPFVITSATYSQNKKNDGFLYGEIDRMFVYKMNDSSENLFALYPSEGSSNVSFQSDNNSIRNNYVFIDKDCYNPAKSIQEFIYLHSPNLENYIKGLKKYPIGKLNKIPPKNTKTDFQP